VDRIASPRNERLQRARRLSERRARGVSGRFLAEGEDLLAAALARGILPEEVFVRDGAALPAALAAALVAAPGTTVTAVAGPALDAIGSLAHGARVVGVYRTDDLPAWPPTPSAVTLVLHGLADPGNVGTLLRACAALGPAAVALGPGTADPLGAKAVRASMGAVFLVPCRPLAEVAATLDGVPAVALDAAATAPLAAADLVAPVVIHLGAERDGVPAAVRDSATLRAIVQEPTPIESLNVAMAGTIALYEARRATQAVSPAPPSNGSPSNPA